MHHVAEIAGDARLAAVDGGKVDLARMLGEIEQRSGAPGGALVQPEAAARRIASLLREVVARELDRLGNIVVLAQRRLVQAREGRDAIDIIGPERRDQLAVARQHDGEHEMHAAVRQDLARYQPILDGKYIRSAEAQDIEGEFVEAESVMGLR